MHLTLGWFLSLLSPEKYEGPILLAGSIDRGSTGYPTIEDPSKMQGVVRRSLSLEGSLSTGDVGKNSRVGGNVENIETNCKFVTIQLGIDAPRCHGYGGFIDFVHFGVWFFPRLKFFRNICLD